MPVTAKLSRRFYEALGDDVANELVDWFNAVDLTYRTDLRELNELNFARFEAKLEQRFAERDVRFDRIDARLDHIDTRLDQIDARLDQFDARFTRIDARFAQVETRLDRLDIRFSQDFAAHRMETEAALGRLRVDIVTQKADMVKWMFLFWLGSVAATVAARLL